MAKSLQQNYKMVIATVMVIVMATVIAIMLLMAMLLFSTVICHCLLPFVIGSSDWYMASAARLDATNCWHRVAASANAGTNSAHTPLPRDGAGGMRMRPTAASNLQGPLTSNTA